MEPPLNRTRPYPTLPLAPLQATAVLVLGVVLACASPGPTLPARSDALPPAGGTLRVQLWFGSWADLDLYVSDPAHETVYFANSPSVSGGRLGKDLRCDAPDPRVEVVSFETPPTGRFRVGVDFPVRCVRSRVPVPYRVVVDGPDLRREVTGEIVFGQFQSKVLEFDLQER